MGLVTVPQKAGQRREQARFGFFQSLYSFPKLSWQVLYPLTSPQATTQSRQRLVPCSKTITTGLRHDPLIISRTWTWRNTQQIMMVWQSHRSTLHSPDLWARGCADTAACLCRGLLQQFGHEPISTCLGGLGACIILPGAWAWTLTQISLTQLSRTWHFSPVQSFSSPHVCLQPWKKGETWAQEREKCKQKNLRSWVGENPNWSVLQHVS